LDNYPHISVIIATYNRPNDLNRCLRSLCAVIYLDWDIIILDQSTTCESQRVVESYIQQLPQLTYWPMQQWGLSWARNYGIRIASGDIIAFLDDDCTVTADWLLQVQQVFQRHPRATLVCGSVIAAAHDRSKHFIPVFDAGREISVRGRLGFLRTGGMGASMYLRRSAIHTVGLFDVHLGPGSGYFDAADDLDYRYRCLARGYSVVTTPAISVIHYGMRDYRSGAAADLINGYALAGSALVMKWLRCGDLGAFVLLAYHGRRYLALTSARQQGERKVSPFLIRVMMYMHGLIASFQLDVDRIHQLYVASQKPAAKSTESRE